MLGAPPLCIYYLQFFSWARDILCCTAVLWLLLLSGSALKWAGLTPSAQHLFAVAQILLSTGVVVAGLLAVVFSTAWGSLQCQVWLTALLASD